MFPGGVAIFAEVMSTLRIEQVEISSGALREGLLYDMLGRLHHEDTRERAIRAMQQRYHVDVEQAERVEATAAALLADVQRAWQLGDERYRQLLVWAARLHEVGLDIAHSRYHQHGGYLLANADLPGFVRLEQKLLAALVASHRRKIEDPFLTDLPADWRVPMFKLVVLLRLAVLLNRTRSPVELAARRPVTGQRSTRASIPAGLARRQSAHRGRSRAGTGLAQSPRVRPACRRQLLGRKLLLRLAFRPSHGRQDASPSWRRSCSCAAFGSSPDCGESCV